MTIGLGFLDAAPPRGVGALSLQYLHVEPGTRQKLAVVTEPSETTRFIADPPEGAAGGDTAVDYECFCHQEYDLDGQEMWVRIIEFGAVADSETGDTIPGVYSVESVA